MRARASIPAWGKLVLSALGVALVIALVTSPIWRRYPDQCGALAANIEAVRSGEAASRVSDAWVRHDRREKYGWSRSVIVGERGDFGGYLSRFTFEACLGDEWLRTRSESVQDAWVREAWRYQRQGWPNVEYLTGIDDGLRTQIVIEARSQ